MKQCTIEWKIKNNIDDGNNNTITHSNILNKCDNPDQDKHDFGCSATANNGPICFLVLSKDTNIVIKNVFRNESKYIFINIDKVTNKHINLTNVIELTCTLYHIDNHLLIFFPYEKYLLDYQQKIKFAFN